MVMAENIAVFIKKPLNIRDAVRVVREYVSVPIATLARQMLNDAPVLVADLDEKQYFAGVREILELLNALDECGCNYRLTRNGEATQRDFLEGLVSRIDGMKLQDFR
jgi:hypothetical protein